MFWSLSVLFFLFRVPFAAALFTLFLYVILSRSVLGFSGVSALSRSTLCFSGVSALSRSTLCFSGASTLTRSILYFSGASALSRFVLGFLHIPGLARRLLPAALIRSCTLHLGIRLHLIRISSACRFLCTASVHDFEHKPSNQEQKQ